MSTANHGITWGRSLETLGYEFLESVLSNMDATSSVRLGETGTGICPNYQVSSNGLDFTFKGNSHEKFQDEPFTSEHISIPFSYAEVTIAMKNAEKLDQAKPVGKQ